MNFKKILGALVLLLSVQLSKAQSSSPVDYVNPLIGTQSKYELSNGNTYPAIAMPWGMNFWTPQTGNMGDGWVYTYTADKIKGFKQTHQPSPWNNDYGQFSIMPTIGEPVFDQEKRASWFSHKAEVVKPYYYSVYLADHDVTTELTPSERGAIFRFTFPKTEAAQVVIDAFDKGSYIKVIPEENKIIGYNTRNSGGVPDNFKNYFVIVFDRSFDFKAAVKSGDIKNNVLEMKDNHAGAIVGFKNLKRGEQVIARVASSFISFEQAELNLKEVKGNTFDEIVTVGKVKWNEVLGRVEVKDPDIDRLKTFYSCLYRSTLFPRDFSEIDAQGKRVHYSPYNGQVLPGEMFTDTGFWDTFRSLFPLLNLIYPEMNDRMQAGLVNAYKESGFLPEWASPGHRESMIGNNSASVVADAFATGRKGYDADLLWDAVVHGANNAHPKISATGRFGHELYNTLGFIPIDKNINQNVARTLEYAYNDWSIYQFGKALGKPNSEISIYAKRAMNYKNIYDAETKLMRGKKSDGTFTPFDPSAWSKEYTEGNAWHWSFCVFHDPQGLIDLMGSKKAFNAMLDTVFVIPSYEGMKSRSMIHEMREMQIMNMGQYAHGNQPIQHMPYLYNYAAEPWKAQYWVRQIMDKLYLPTPDGYCGDEDNGQTSAWYVFSALGFYPVAPASGEYVLGSPQFQSVKLNLQNGKTLKIDATNQNKDNVYVNEVKVNGKMYTKNFFQYKELMKGGELQFDMADKPNKKRGIKDTDAPYSFSKMKL
ncbi:GH92 family glycosyl hydrolase [Sphingobacterium sp. JUb56]|uniref:GH92 family glycosyl hydrolase n=1 Tax=Sphingobacterium sp. JUb56 TaxID=2587145 RepID=UPI00162133A8|nr:GH92 family glycosyl hydrolase [Sphingobacterium sp. JUb56]MBB2954081.1 putative alpha-1,2-mannosidase [Sphingobacterium sp. JUb56]